MCFNRNLEASMQCCITIMRILTFFKENHYIHFIAIQLFTSANGCLKQARFLVGIIRYDVWLGSFDIKQPMELPYINCSDLQ